MKWIIFLLKQKCIFNQLTDLYCPGCGGTRAVFFLLTGHPLLSLRCHPLVIFTLFGIIINIFLKIKNKKHHLSKAWLWAALVVVAINFLVKNALLLHGIDLLNVHISDYI